MNEHILNFLQQQTCASMCVVDDQGKPYCFSAFYAFNSDAGLFYFKSSKGSHHAQLMSGHTAIAGTVLPDKLSKILVQGIQFEGVVLDHADPLTQKVSGYYHKKFPLALVLPGELWTVRADHIKMTDSTQGFGKKIIWSRNS